MDPQNSPGIWGLMGNTGPTPQKSAGNEVLDSLNQAFDITPAAPTMFRRRLPNETAEHYMEDFRTSGLPLEALPE